MFKSYMRDEKGCRLITAEAARIFVDSGEWQWAMRDTNVEIIERRVKK